MGKHLSQFFFFFFFFFFFLVLWHGGFKKEQGYFYETLQMGDRKFFFGNLISRICLPLFLEQVRVL